MNLTTTIPESELLEIVTAAIRSRTGMRPENLQFHVNGNGIEATATFAIVGKESTAGRPPMFTERVRAALENIPVEELFEAPRVRAIMEEEIGRRFDDREIVNLSSRLFQMAKRGKTIRAVERTGSCSGKRNRYQRIKQEQ